MAGIESVEVAVAGGRTRVLTSGPADDGDAVVLVHGNPGPADDWRDLLGRAGDLGRAIAPDMPGFGQADTPAGFGYSTGDYAGYLAALLEQQQKGHRAHQRHEILSAAHPAPGEALHH